MMERLKEWTINWIQSGWERKSREMRRSKKRKKEEGKRREEKNEGKECLDGGGRRGGSGKSGKDKNEKEGKRREERKKEEGRRKVSQKPCRSCVSINLLQPCVHLYEMYTDVHAVINTCSKWYVVAQILLCRLTMRVPNMDKKCTLSP